MSGLTSRVRLALGVTYLEKWLVIAVVAERVASAVIVNV